MTLIFNCNETNFFESNNVHQIFFVKVFDNINPKSADNLANIITTF